MSRRAHQSRTKAHPLTRAQARAASKSGREVRARRSHVLGRATPAARNPDYIEVKITTRLVRHAAKVIDRDPTLVTWLRDELLENQKGPGRPTALSLRTALICYWLLAVTQRNFFIINLASLVDSMSWRVRRQLGIDYIASKGAAKQVSYEQLLRLFHRIADTFDPYAKGPDGEPISDVESHTRAASLQQFVNRLVRASTADVIHCGDYAGDATLKWAHERPRRSGGKKDLNRKIPRRGHDGDAGPPAALSEVAELDQHESLEAAGLVRDPLENAQRRKSRYDTKTWGGGADWVGRTNKAKSVFGFALHTLTVSDANAPNVIEAMSVTTAKALPAPALMPMIAELAQVRADQGLGLGNVVADPAYSADPGDWQLPLRALGATPWFRLHRTNQAGLRSAPSGHLFVDGRPTCACAVHGLDHQHFPPWPHSAEQAETHAKWAEEKRARFEMKPNGPFRPDGGRQFFSVHYEGTVSERTGRPGGCSHCVDAYGNAVIDPGTGRPRPRCCIQRTRKYSATELGNYMEAGHGTTGWFEHWNPRNRVEGSYGVLKNLALVNWGRSYHHFVGLARETLVALFAVLAYNFQTINTFRAWAARAAEKGEQRGKRKRGRHAKALAKPSAQPTMTTPAGVERTADAARPASGPKGLEFLGTPLGP